MAYKLDPETVDLAELARFLRDTCGAHVFGVVVGRTLMRDAIVEYLQCSPLDAENLVETMIARGFIAREGALGTDIEWVIPER